MDARIAALESSVAALSDSLEMKLASFSNNFVSDKLVLGALEMFPLNLTLFRQWFSPILSILVTSIPIALLVVSFLKVAVPICATSGNLELSFPDSFLAKIHWLGFTNLSSSLRTTPPLSTKRLSPSHSIWTRRHSSGSVDMIVSEVLLAWKTSPVPFVANLAPLSLKIVQRHSSNWNNEVPSVTILFEDWLIELKI